MQVYRLTLATIFQRKVWIIAFLCVLVLPLVLPYLTPYESNPTLIEPARAQAVWICLWVVTISWMFFQAARFGDDTARSGLGAYFLSTGVSRLGQMLQIWLACLTFLLPLVAVAVGVCLIGAMPGDRAQVAMWVNTNLQFAVLFILVAAPLMMLATAVGSRFGGMIGFLVPVSMSVYGLFGVGYVGMMTVVRDNPFLDWFYVVSPHYHFADLTTRLEFKHGSMLGAEFLEYVIYFLGIKLVLSTFSTLCFKAKPIA